MTARYRRGFTLIEVMIAVFIAAIVFLAIMAGLIYVIKAQKIARERSLAQRQATAILENAKRLAFANLAAYSDRTVLIDDNRTPDDPTDDLVGKSRLRLYSFSNAGNHTEINEARSQEFIIAQSEITWKSMGKDRLVVFTSHMAP